jgi:hypothetical protein
MLPFVGSLPFKYFLIRTLNFIYSSLMHILFKDTSYAHAAMSVPYIDLFLEL